MADKITALKELGRHLTSESFRKSLSIDPINTLRHLGIDVSALSMEEIEVLRSLSPSELKFLADLSAGIDEKIAAADQTGGIVY